MVITTPTYRFLCFITSLTLIIYAKAAPTYRFHFCSNAATFPPNTTYQSNLDELLSVLSSNAATEHGYYNTTTGVNTPGNTVYGSFLCRGDVSADTCRGCVSIAAKQVLQNCPVEKDSMIWYDECMLRYSNAPFFSTLDELPMVYMWNVANTNNINISNQDQDPFNQALGVAMNAAATVAARGGADKKFGTKEVNFSSFQTLYTLAQCTPDLSLGDCSVCLALATSNLPACCSGKQGGRVLLPSCNIRYELYPFFTFLNSPVYLNHNCTSDKSFTPSLAFQSNLKTLLSSFSSNVSATGKSTEFYNTSVGGNNEDTVCGLFMCRGDVAEEVCKNCIVNASDQIVSRCMYSQEAIIWYEQCLVRYSNRCFFSTMSEQPRFIQSETTGNNTSDFNETNYGLVVVGTASDALTEAANGDTKKFATKSGSIAALESVHTLVQCTPDLSSDDCETCLRAMRDDINSCCLGKGMIGGKVLSPSCILMFSLNNFYSDLNVVNFSVGAAEPGAPTPPDVGTGGSAPPGKGGAVPARTIVIAVVVLIAVSTMFFCLGCHFLRRRATKKYDPILRQHFGIESTTLESLQIDFATIEAATNKFSPENWIGKGGFGEVYKGVLSDGREVAVKRLSISSGQGILEFKNEILLIFKLQHKNLVALLGFCLQGEEKILVYEFVPNKSLNYFLFDSEKRRLLHWSKRYKIINGIARAILYLHEYSRLKIIHRDLKPSNILLDHDMNSKISDFGLARLVVTNQDEDTTKRIVGTYGYMSPEYVMFGQFSEKSDIFSFGVIVLETISGKRNARSYELHVDGLLNYAWKQWRDGAALEILDPFLRESYSEIEVTRCIQIGLLCVQENSNDRPQMATVVSYLSNFSLELPYPREPAYMHGREEKHSKVEAMESGSSHSTNNNPPSINKMSITYLLPR